MELQKFNLDYGNKVIGTASISQIDWINRNANYGRLIYSSYQKKGFGTEVIKILKKYSFDHLNLNTITNGSLVYESIVNTHLYHTHNITYLIL